MAKAKKKVMVKIKLQIPAGAANPAPPVGPALGQHGVNIMMFCKAFNDQTKQKQGLILPVVISVYEDKSFDFILKSPPASVLLKRAANLAKASGNTGKEIAGEVTKAQVMEIVKEKAADLNAVDLEHAARIIMGTARSCGIKVKE
jgi:large subunit ribosomal protein L11